MKILKNIYNRLFIIIFFFLLFFFYELSIEGNISNNKDINKRLDEDSSILELYFLDVGEADSTLIKKNNNYMLVDSGNNEDGDKLVSYFKDLGVNYFSYVFGTHAHEDHIGGMDNILRNFRVDHYLMPSLGSDMITYTEIINELNRKGLSLEIPSTGNKYYLDDVVVEVLSVDYSEEDINDSSIVLKVTYKDIDILLMSDVSYEVEKSILDKVGESEVLKVGHHGSSYSTSSIFLKKVNPKYAIISVGKENDYNLPKDVTLKKLDYLGVKVYRTDIDGSIKMKSDGESISFDVFNTDLDGS